MNRRKNNLKGVMKVLEVVIASSILLVGLGMIVIQKSSDSLDDLKYQAHNALEHLDNTGILRQISKTEDLQELRSMLVQKINYNFKVVFCKNSCDASGIPDNIDVVIVDHYVSGYADSDGIKSDIKKIRVYLWK